MKRVRSLLRVTLLGLVLMSAGCQALYWLNPRNACAAGDQLGLYLEESDELPERAGTGPSRAAWQTWVYGVESATEQDRIAEVARQFLHDSGGRVGGRDELEVLFWSGPASPRDERGVVVHEGRKILRSVWIR
jgi:hypothetical protein